MKINKNTKWIQGQDKWKEVADKAKNSNNEVVEPDEGEVVHFWY